MFAMLTKFTKLLQPCQPTSDSNEPWMQRKAAKAAAREQATAPLANDEEEPLSEFEEQRLQNIARNHSMLANLGIAAFSPTLARPAAGQCTPNQPKSRQHSRSAGDSVGARPAQCSSGKEQILPPRDSKGRFLSGSSGKAAIEAVVAQVTAGSVLGSEGPAKPGIGGSPQLGIFRIDANNSCRSSGVTVAVAEGSLATSFACDMATWQLPDSLNCTQSKEPERPSTCGKTSEMHHSAEALHMAHALPAHDCSGSGGSQQQGTQSSQAATEPKEGSFPASTPRSSRAASPEALANLGIKTLQANAPAFVKDGAALSKNQKKRKRAPDVKGCSAPARYG